jgi:hypothetical protein
MTGVDSPIRDEERLRRLFGDVALPAIQARAALWPIATWLLPIHLTSRNGPDSEQEVYLAKEQALPCAPAADDWRSIAHGRTQVDRVQWTEDAQVIVLLRPVELSKKDVRGLRSDGWEIASPDDSERLLSGDPS